MKAEEEWGTLATNHVRYRSPSQLNDMERCGWMYFLKRRARVWERPAAWLAHGTAVHTALEKFWQSGGTMTLEEAQEVFRQQYRALIAIHLKETPNPREWFNSGPHGGAKDIERRFHVGQQHVQNVLDYYAEHPELIPWIDPDGHLWVEKHFKAKFGDVEVVGYVDVVHDGIPYDYKTGTTPGGDEQLATYAGVLKQSFDIPFSHGFYFMARNGKPTKPYDLTGWSLERLADVYGDLDEKIKAEDFTPNPSHDVCSRCPVATSCEFKHV